MIGDRDDMAARLRAVLPERWFGDHTPVLGGVLAGVAEMWATLYDQLQAVIRQTRLATATDAFLDMISADYFGWRLSRRIAEGDAAFRSRIRRELLRERGTRGALIAALTDLTGRAPSIFEPARPADTGAWNGAIGYGLAGRWGSLLLPRQCFVVARRPQGQGIALVAGWGDSVGGWGGGAIAWGDRDQIAGQVTDAEIAAVVAQTMPVATIAWLRIES